jgi:predicted Fe-Mo cluster-binding NifX family protein
MRLAIPVWAGRVSPVFDVAGQVLVVELVEGRQVAGHQHPIAEVSPTRRADTLVRLGVDVLVCGAISRGLEAALLAQGICVIARISGQTERIIQAFIANELHDAAFQMPGCSQSAPVGANGLVPRQRRRRGRRPPNRAPVRLNDRGDVP